MATESLDIAIRQSGAQQTAAAIAGVGNAAGAAAPKVAATKREVENLGRSSSRIAPVGTALRKLKADGEAAKKSISDVREAVGAFGAVTAAVGAALLFTKLSDTSNRVQSQLALITKSEAERAALSEKVFAIAQETGVELESQTKLVARLSSSADQLGVSQAEVLRLSRLVSQTFTISGATSSEAASSAQQFAQAIGSGVLQGDELRAILENNSALAQALADGLHVARGELKGMGEAGQLTAERVLPAILSQAGKINEQFGKAIPLISQGATRLENSAIRFVGRLDQAIGLSRVLGGLLTSAGESLDEFGVFLESKTFKDFQISVGGGIAPIVDGIRTATGNGDRVGTAIGSTPGPPRVTNSGTFTGPRAGGGLPPPKPAAAPAASDEELKRAAEALKAARTQAEKLRDEIKEIEALGAKGAFKNLGAGAFERTLAAARAELAALNTQSAAQQVSSDAESTKAAEQKFLDEVEDAARALGDRREDAKRFFEQSLSDADRLAASLAEVRKLQEEGAFAGLPDGAAEKVAAALLKEIADVRAQADGTADAMQRVRDFMAEAAGSGDPIKQQLLDIERLKGTGQLSGQALASAEANLREHIARVNGQYQQQLTESQQAILDIGLDISDGLADAIGEGFKGGFDIARAVAAEALREIAVAQIKAAASNFLQNFVLGAVSAYTGVKFGAVADGSSLSKGPAGGSSSSPKAMGGLVTAGSTYLVGETGPERFTATTNGQITPSGPTSREGSAGPSVLVVNEQNPESLIAALETSGGTRVIRNLVSNNREDFRRILGVA